MRSSLDWCVVGGENVNGCRPDMSVFGMRQVDGGIWRPFWTVIGGGGKSKSCAAGRHPMSSSARQRSRR